jgi:hypothetical protein
MAQPRNLKGQFVTDGQHSEESKHEQLEKAKDFPKFRELREPVIPKNHGMSGKLYGHYGHYQF